jgi:hypothetical protein
LPRSFESNLERMSSRAGTKPTRVLWRTGSSDASRALTMPRSTSAHEVEAVYATLNVSLQDPLDPARAELAALYFAVSAAFGAELADG